MVMHQDDSGIRLMSVLGRVSRGSPVQTAMRNCTRDEGRSFEAGSQVLASNRCKLLSSKAMPGRLPPPNGNTPAAFLCPPENLPYPLPRKTDRVPNRLEGRTCFPRLRNRLITLDPARNLMPA